MFLIEDLVYQGVQDGCSLFDLALAQFIRQVVLQFLKRFEFLHLSVDGRTLE